MKQAILVTVLIGVFSLVAACGGTEDEFVPMDVSGFWEGTWQTDSGSSSGGVTISITQSQTTLTGQGMLTNIPLINTQQGPVNGSLQGNTITGLIDGSLADVEFSTAVSPDGKSMSGWYKLSNGVRGLLNLTR
jgi:hypothetical protein